MTTDVPEPGRAEHRIGEGVGDGVGVAVPLQSPGAIAGDDHPAEDQRTRRIIGEPVHVEPLADPQGRQPAVHRSASPMTPISASATRRSSGRVNLRLWGSPATVRTVAPQLSTSAASSVA